MAFNYTNKEFIVGKKIVSYTILSDSHIEFKFSDNSKATLVAESDCCGDAWFEIDVEKEHIKGIVNKTITDLSVKTLDPDILPPSGKQDYDDLKQVIISFDDDTELKIYLRGSSNGYYDCYLSIRK
jgi:hypothetical protein